MVDHHRKQHHLGSLKINQWGLMGTQNDCVHQQCYWDPTYLDD